MKSGCGVVSEVSERPGFITFCAESARKDSTPLAECHQPIGNEHMLMTIPPTFSKSSHLPLPPTIMLRKPTRPTIVAMPRRVPTLQLSPKTAPHSILRRPTPQQSVNRLSRTPHKRVRFTSDVEFSSVNSELPRRVIVSCYAADPHSILRDILTEKNFDPEAANSYKLLPGTVLPTRDCKVKEGRQIPTIALGTKHRATPSLAFPGVKGHRFWKLKPGLYRLVDSDKLQRVVLLRVGKSVVRTPLPNGVPGPPDGDKNLFLEVGAAKDLQRVSGKWISV